MLVVGDQDIQKKELARISDEIAQHGAQPDRLSAAKVAG